MAEAKREKRSRLYRTLATLAHNVVFFVAICSGFPWNWIGIGLLVVVLLGQLMVWRKVLEASTGNIAGFTTVMYLFRDHDPSRPNVALAVVIVGAEIILVLTVESIRRWRGERLTPPPVGP